MSFHLRDRHFLTLDDYTPEEIDFLLHTIKAVFVATLGG